MSIASHMIQLAIYVPDALRSITLTMSISAFEIHQIAFLSASHNKYVSDVSQDLRYYLLELVLDKLVTAW